MVEQKTDRKGTAGFFSSRLFSETIKPVDMKYDFWVELWKGLQTETRCFENKTRDELDRLRAKYESQGYRFTVISSMKR